MIEIIKFTSRASPLTTCNEDPSHTQGKTEVQQEVTAPPPHKHHELEKPEAEELALFTHTFSIYPNEWEQLTHLKIHP